MLEAASASAEEVLASSTATIVPGAFFDKLWSGLSKPPKAAPGLAKRARTPRRVTQR